MQAVKIAPDFSVILIWDGFYEEKKFRKYNPSALPWFVDDILDDFKHKNKSSKRNPIASSSKFFVYVNNWNHHFSRCSSSHWLED